MSETITAVLYCIIWGCDRFQPLPHSPDKQCWTMGYTMQWLVLCTPHILLYCMEGWWVSMYALELQCLLHWHMWWMGRCRPWASIVHWHMRCTGIWDALVYEVPHVWAALACCSIKYPYQFASIYCLTHRLVVVMDCHLSWCLLACVILVCHVCPSTSMTGYYDADNQFQCTTSSSQPHMLCPWNYSDKWWMPVNHNSMYSDTL